MAIDAESAKPKPTPNMQVAQAIAELRDQLIAARHQGAEKGLKFLVRSVELEMHLVLTTEASGEAKIGWGVLSLGGGAKATDAVTHKLKLTLDLTDGAGATGVEVGANSPGGLPDIGKKP
jgi:hypothetical protein